MTKKTERTGDPVVAQVPWGAAPNALDQATDAFEAAGDATPSFAPEMTAEVKSDDFAERIKSAFSGQPMAQASPFAPKPKVAPAPEPEIFDLGDAPSWGELVAFVQRHGKDIIQVRYPAPRGVAIDTLYRGVTVFTHPTCELRHVKLGWIAWQDAQYE